MSPRPSARRDLLAGLAAAPLFTPAERDRRQTPGTALGDVAHELARLVEIGDRVEHGTTEREGPARLGDDRVAELRRSPTPANTE